VGAMAPTKPLKNKIEGNFECGPLHASQIIFFNKEKRYFFKKVYAGHETFSFMVISYIVLVALSSICYLENNIR
jgi:hypothetical protein